MPDFFVQSIDSVEPALFVIILRLSLAWLAGCGVAFVSRQHRKTVADKTLGLTLVLMCVLIAMATQIIGDNVARAFGLVGALSIVRFRTAVQTTQDVAFVLSAVIVGMAIGAGQYWVAGLGLVVLAAATHLYPFWSSNQAELALTQPVDLMRLSMQVSNGTVHDFTGLLIELCESHEITSGKTVQKGKSFAFNYRVALRENVSVASALVRIGKLEQIEAVQLKRI